MVINLPCCIICNTVAQHRGLAKALRPFELRAARGEPTVRKYPILLPLMLAFWAVSSPSFASPALQFPSAAIDDQAAASRAMPKVAAEALVIYRQGADRAAYLDDLFRLQIVAQQYAKAGRTLKELRGLRRSPREVAQTVPYEIAVGAAVKGGEFGKAFAQTFRETFAALDDQTSALADRALGVDLTALQQTLRAALDQQKGKTSIALGDALKLIRAYQVVEDHRRFAPLTRALVSEDDQRRYLIDKDVQVKISDGATVCTLIVRPRMAPVRLTTLLEFTIYADADTNMAGARLSASHGYAGVVGLTRGKGCSPDTPTPYEHDGADAAAVIGWLASQSWSDGRAGMFGGSYSGFTPWAAAKHRPAALKAIMVGAPVAPGVDVPMEGNVFWSFVYPWPFYTTNEKSLDKATYFDNDRWQRLNRTFYVDGRAYRDLDKIDGTPNPIFRRWLAHPGYDAYWQSMIPYRDEFAAVQIPVLETAGYYFGGPGAAKYYFSEHTRYNPLAEHYLLIGPYDHLQAQRGTIGALGDKAEIFAGYRRDPSAQIDLIDLRYRWFDYVFRGAEKPPLLAARVNYQMMGADTWRHAPSIAAMAATRKRFYLNSARANDSYRMSVEPGAADAAVLLSVDLRDRSDIDAVIPGGGIEDTALDSTNAVVFVSDPIVLPMDAAGLFSGHLEFSADRSDFDFVVGLYELTPGGTYAFLSPYSARASYVADHNHRHLLTPGERTGLDFESLRLMGRRLQKGSRLVVVLGIVKNAGQQINYGSGRDVSDETIADAAKPLSIKWFADSYIDVPLRP